VGGYVEWQVGWGGRGMGGGGLGWIEGVVVARVVVSGGTRRRVQGGGG